MTKVILIRHARSIANAAGILAGRTAGVGLDQQGVAQARALAGPMAEANIAAAYSSPLQRCLQTASLAGFQHARVVADLTECDYGTWSGRKISDLVKEPLWPVIQQTPSKVSFPEGESMQQMQRRCITAIENIVARHAGEVVAVFSHGDPLKAIIAEALHMPFDDFQRLQVAPASVSVIDYSAEKPLMVCLNAGNMESLLRAPAENVLGGGDSVVAD